MIQREGSKLHLDFGPGGVLNGQDSIYIALYLPVTCDTLGLKLSQPLGELSSEAIWQGSLVPSCQSRPLHPLSLVHQASRKPLWSSVLLGLHL